MLCLFETPKPGSQLFVAGTCCADDGTTVGSRFKPHVKGPVANVEREAVGLPTHRLSQANQQPVMVADDVVDGSAGQLACVLCSKP
jgi:hypothetical protein